MKCISIEKNFSKLMDQPHHISSEKTHGQYGSFLFPGRIHPIQLVKYKKVVFKETTMKDDFTRNSALPINSIDNAVC
jgi:hypothetical protein